MKRHMNLTKAAALSAVALILIPAAALGATRTFDFEGAEYGTPNELCGPNVVPPLLNRPEFGSQSAEFIIDPSACGQGDCGANPTGSDSRLTNDFAAGGSNSEEIRFSWEDETNDDSFARLITATAQGVVPKFQSPTVHLGVGSKISMDLVIYGTLATEAAVTCVPDSPGGQLEFALAIRETGVNLPLGEDGGTDGDVEYVGVTGVGGVVEPFTPIGGVALTHSAAVAFTTVTWEFTDVDTNGTVEVSVKVGAGAPEAKDVAAFTGDGVLRAANNRGTLDSLAIRKHPDDDTTKKWYVYVDNIVIDAPGVVDPVAIQGPVSDLSTEVTVNNIDLAATEVRLYKNPPFSPTDPIVATTFVPGPDTHTFTGLTLTAGDVLTATQVVGTESDPSAPVEVQSGICLDDFSGGVDATADPIGGGDFGVWYDATGDTFGTAAASTLDDSPALRITDGGFKNGVYIIYEAAIPADGTYSLTADMHVAENPTQTNSIQQYQMGVVVNGVHRDLTIANPGDTHLGCHNESLIAVDTALPGNAVGSYVGLTAGDDSAKPTQIVKTGSFDALAGDHLLVVFCTNVETQWQNVALDALGALDTQDNCEAPAPGFPPPPRTPVFNEQGTWNIRENRSSTSLTWGGGAAQVRVDNICLAPFDECINTPTVSVQTPVIAGQTSVTVTGVDTANAVAVTVYSWDGGTLTQIGQETGTAGTLTDPITVDPVTSLISGRTIFATQTIGIQEGCKTPADIIGPIVDDCNQILGASVTGPVNADEETVEVSGLMDVDGDGTNDAEAVTVYAIGVGQIGQVTGAPGSIPDPVSVPTSALVKGQTLGATQTVLGLPGCTPTTGQVVGSGSNSGILLSLGIRETNPAGAVGEDGGITGSIEWIIDPANACSPSPPQGFLIAPSFDWQTVTFDPTDPLAICNFNAGDGVLVDAKGVLEHLAISADPASLDVGPYTLYIDNITSGGTNFGDVEGITAGEQAIFRQPSFSGSSTGHIVAPPNLSVVDGAVGDASNQSVRVEWRFVDEGANRWIRLTTAGTPNIPNPIVDLTQPITLRVLLQPVVGCNNPYADTEPDGDVDGDDFGKLQACLTADAAGILPGCACFNRDGDDDVDSDDIGPFDACASGPDVPANPTCDD